MMHAATIACSDHRRLGRLRIAPQPHMESLSDVPVPQRLNATVTGIQRLRSSRTEAHHLAVNDRPGGLRELLGLLLLLVGTR